MAKRVVRGTRSTALCTLGCATGRQPKDGSADEPVQHTWVEILWSGGACQTTSLDRRTHKRARQIRAGRGVSTAKHSTNTHPFCVCVCVVCVFSGMILYISGVGKPTPSHRSAITSRSACAQILGSRRAAIRNPLGGIRNRADFHPRGSRKP